MLAVAKKLGPNMDAHEFAHYTADVLDVDENMTWYEMELRLADLIDPTDGFDLDTVQRVCFECMEGCDEPEWTLYTTIHDAIARYKRGESVPTYDRDALLRLADELEAGARVARARRWNEPANAAMAIALADEYEANARRIREALGEGA